MHPTRRFQDWSRLSVRQIKLAVSVIGVRLQDAGVFRQMQLRMFALAIARVVKYGGWRPRSAKGPIVANVDPASPGVGLAFGQNGHGRIIPMKALGRQDMGFHKAPNGISAAQTDPTASAMVDRAIGTPSRA